MAVLCQVGIGYSSLFPLVFQQDFNSIVFQRLYIIKKRKSYDSHKTFDDCTIIAEHGSSGFKRTTGCNKIINQQYLRTRNTINFLNTPYSSSKLFLWALPGSFPSFPTNTKGTCNRSAKGAAKIKPRASTPTMQVIFLVLQSSSILSMQ